MSEEDSGENFGDGPWAEGWEDRCGSTPLLYARKDMTKYELITKQQIEIETLKAEMEGMREAIGEARNHLCRPEQWSTKCPDFPRVAMVGIVRAREALDSIN